MPALTANAYVGGRGDHRGARRRGRRRHHRPVHGCRPRRRPRGLVARLVVRRRRRWLRGGARPARRRGRGRPRHRVRRAGHRRQLRLLRRRPRDGARRVPDRRGGADGSSVITKHDGTGGLVTPGTVTAQLLYEVGGPEYANPDVTARFDSIRLDQVGRDRVRISGGPWRGAAPQRLKVALNYLGGFRNSMTLVLTGLDTDAKADLALRDRHRAVAGRGTCTTGARRPSSAQASRLRVRELHVELVRSGRSRTRPRRRSRSRTCGITVKDADPAKVGKPFTTAVVESALASYPGMFPTAPPADGTPYGVYWPTSVPAEAVTCTVRLDSGAGEPDVVATVPGGRVAVAARRRRRPAGCGRQRPGCRRDHGRHAALATPPPGRPSGCRWGCSLGAAVRRQGRCSERRRVGPRPGRAAGRRARLGRDDALVAPEVDAEHDTAALWDIDDPGRARRRRRRQGRRRLRLARLVADPGAGARAAAGDRRRCASTCTRCPTCAR